MPHRHEASAGMDVEDGRVAGVIRLCEASLAETAAREPLVLPLLEERDARGPGDIDRMSDHLYVRSGRGVGGIMTPEGWKTVREPPGRDGIFRSIWGEKPSAAAQEVQDAAYAAATEAADKARAAAAAQAAADAGGVVKGDPPKEKWNLLRLTNPWARRPLAVALAVAFGIVLIVMAIWSMVLVIWDGICCGWDGLVESAKRDLRGNRRHWRLFVDAIKLGWRGA